MASNQRKAQGAPAAPFLAEFRPLKELWEATPPLFPGEQSARWWMRNHGPQLAEVRAVAIHRRALFVHPQRVAEVIEREAIETYRARAGKAAP